MNFRELTSRLSRTQAAIIGSGLLALVLIAGIVVASSGGGDSPESPDPTPDLAVGPDVAPTSTPQATPTATATPAPPSALNRASCEAIRSTPYLSDEERDWFIANCSANPAAARDAPAVGGGGGAGQVSIGDTLVIPAAGVSAEIYRATVPGSGAMPDPIGYFNAVWYDFGNWPGLGGYVNAGNLVLSGHVDWARCQNGGPGLAVFYNVRKLSAGDTAEYRTSDGKVVKYVVTASYALSASTDFENIVSSNTADMTLITCTGTFSGGSYNQRHVVAFKKV